MPVPHSPMQVPQPPTSINTMRPIPILLEIILFINKESGDLDECAVLYDGVGKKSCAVFLFVPAVQ